jgi:hypothetical protein
MKVSVKQIGPYRSPSWHMLVILTMSNDRYIPSPQHRPSFHHKDSMTQQIVWYYEHLYCKDYVWYGEGVVNVWVGRGDLLGTRKFDDATWQFLTMGMVKRSFCWEMMVHKSACGCIEAMWGVWSRILLSIILEDHGVWCEDWVATIISFHDNHENKSSSTIFDALTWQLLSLGVRDCLGI